MLQTILLPLDGSPLSERALPYATALAQQSGASIVLVEAAQAHTLPGADPSGAQIDVTDRAEAYLRDIADRLAGQGILSEQHVYYDDAVHAILDAAARHPPDLIVMSTHGRSGLGRMLYGSVADQVLRHATVPILLVPSVTERAWPTDRPLSLLVPLDGSELSEAALSAADLLAEGFDAQLTLLSIVEPPGYAIYGDGYAAVPFDDDQERANARKYLDRRVAELLERGRRVTLRVAVGSPPGLIAAIAKEQDDDVIVMATHGSGGLKRLLLGSVAVSTVQHATVPVLLVRPTVASGAEAACPLTTDTLTDNLGADVTVPVVPPSPTADVPLAAADLELIRRGLKALAYMPGYDYDQAPTIRALLDRLAEVQPDSEAVALDEARQPVGTL